MLNAQLSHHAAKRLQQRGIPEKILPFLFEFGEESYDHHGARIVYFNKKARERVSRIMGGSEFKRIQGALDVYAVLDCNDCVVTIGHRTHRINRN
jgi:hypothetical protein